MIVDVVGDLIVVDVAVGIEVAVTVQVAVAVEITVGIPDVGLDGLPGILVLTLALALALALALSLTLQLSLKLGLALKLALSLILGGIVVLRRGVMLRLTHDTLLLFRRHRCFSVPRLSSALRVPLQTMSIE